MKHRNPIRKTARINLRLRAEQKRIMRQKARAAKKTLTEWLIDAALSASE